MIAKKILNIFTVLIIFIFACILIYIFYKSEIYAGFSRFYYYKKYYFIILFFIFLYSFSLFFNEKIRIFFVYTFFILTITFYSFEIYLYVLEKQKPNIFKEYKKKIKIDTNWAVPFTPKISTNLFNFSEKKYLPLSGISKINTLYCNENNYWATYKSDRYGFNNQDEIWDKKIDLVLLGDSYTKGACVNSDENISAHLQKIGLNVLNLGQGGNGPLIELATLIEYIPLVETKKVLWLYSNNDLDDLILEKNSTLKSYLKNNASLNLHKMQDEIDKTYINYLKNYKKNSYFDFLSILKLLRFRMKIIEKYLTDTKKTDSIQYNLLINQDLKEILLTAKNILDNNNQEFYFVYVPGRENFYPKKYLTTYTKVKELKPQIIAMVKELNIKIIDLEMHLKDEIVSKIFPKRGHYNTKGYQFIAEGIFENLK